MNNSKKMNAIISLCSMSFIVLASSATSPALSAIAKNFPDASSVAVASIATLSSLTALPFILLSGQIVGKKISFKALSVIGLIISTIGGFMPYFSSTIGQILLGRALLGVGTGLLEPILSVLTLSLFEGKDIAKQFSRNMMSTNTGAVIFQLAGGSLCNINWRMPFYVYLLIIPVAVIVLFLLPEPEKIVREEYNQDGKHKISEICTPHVIFWGVLHGLYMACFYAYVTESSGIIVDNGYGDSFVVAIILSVFTACGVLGGYLFYPLNNKIGLKTMAVGFCLGLIGNIGLQFANNISLYSVFTIIYGVGYGMLAPAISYYLGIKLNPTCRASSVAIETLFLYLGSSGSPVMMSFFRNIFNSSWERFSFLISMVFYLIVTLFFVAHKDSERSIV